MSTFQAKQAAAPLTGAPHAGHLLSPEYDAAMKIAGQIGALAAFTEELQRDLTKYHPDAHPVVRSGVDLIVDYVRVLSEQPHNRALAQAMAVARDIARGGNGGGDLKGGC